MPTAIVTGSGGLIGSESVRHFVEAGYDVVGIENDMRARFFGPEASTAHDHRARWSTSSPEFRSLDARHPRRRRRRARCSPSTRGAIELVVHTAAQPSHDWAARDPQTDFAVNANGTLNLLEAARDALPRTRPSSSPRPTRSTATRPNRAAARGARDAARAARGPPLLRRHRHVDVDRPLDCTRCSASRRRRPTCWCRSTGATSTCRPSASAAAASPGPQHAGAQLHGFLAYLMKCTVTGDAVHGLRLRRQAGARQHPQRRPRRAPSRPSTRAPRAARRLQHRRRPRVATARCSRRSRPASGSPAASSTGRSRDQARIGDHRWWISRPRRVPAPTTRTGSSSYDIEEILREIHDANVERWTRGRGMKLSVVIPAHNEEGSIARHRRRRSSRRSSARAIDYEIDRRRRRTAPTAPPRSSTRAGGANRRACAASARTTAAASASPCGPASSASRATRWRS